jgi:flagellum-specific ATP synthase
MNEPIADTARGILDGHIVLSRKLSSAGHYPAISVLDSISRVKNDIADREHLQASQKIQTLLATYADAEDLISVGAYQRGSSPKIDKSIQMIDRINSFLMQEVHASHNLSDTIRELKELANQ